MTQKLAAIQRIASYVQHAGYKALVEEENQLESFYDQVICVDILQL
jgi:hypothetical protein